jgi:hypothetical protein
VNDQENDLLELIRRGRRSTVESRRILLTSSELLHERRRLRFASLNLFHAIAELSRDFVEEVERKKPHPAESRN